MSVHHRTCTPTARRSGWQRVHGRVDRKNGSGCHMMLFHGSDDKAMANGPRQSGLDTSDFRNFSRVISLTDPFLAVNSLCIG